MINRNKNENEKLPVYLVMTHPRCGSSYLCHLLSLHPNILDYHESLMLNHSFGYPGTMEIIKTHFKGINDYSVGFNEISKIPVEGLFSDTFWPEGKHVTGCKMFWELRHHGSQKDTFTTAHYWMRNFLYITDKYRDRLKVIYLNRSHSLRQYLSFQYALKNDHWNSLRETKKENRIKFIQEDFVSFLNSHLCSGNRPKFMEVILKNIPSITVDYSGILRRDKMLKTINEIYGFLGLDDVEVNFNEVQFKKQHDTGLFNLVTNPDEMKSFLQSNQKYKKFIIDEC